MTAQEIFDTVARGLIRQGEPGGSGDNCFYRSVSQSSGRPVKCAAGMLMRDEDYSPELEDKGADFLVEQALGGMGRFLAHGMLIQSMQVAHDREARQCRDPDDPADGRPEWLQLFREKMRIIAKDQGLSSEALDDIQKGATS
jgi:hypothetical protein